jgi:hypothetical protein
MFEGELNLSTYYGQVLLTMRVLAPAQWHTTSPAHQCPR